MGVYMRIWVEDHNGYIHDDWDGEIVDGSWRDFMTGGEKAKRAGLPDPWAEYKFTDHEEYIFDDEGYVNGMRRIPAELIDVYDYDQMVNGETLRSLLGERYFEWLDSFFETEPMYIIVGCD